MAERFDAVIVGGGHNGLVAATYLARGGLKVLVLERRHMVGGACVTEELFPGYRLSSCSYICHLLQEQVIRDLDLPRHGFEVFPLEPARFHPFPDGRHLVVWEDVQRTAGEIERYSKRDAAAYPRWVALWERAAALLHPYFLAPAPTYAELAARVHGTPDEEVFETLLTRPMWDLVHEYFESDVMRAHTLNAQDLGDPRAPGSALVYAYIRVNLRSAPGTVGIVKGGMGSITRAMAAAAVEAGVTIRTDVEVARVDVRNGRAVGVVLADGGNVGADAVVSNADPKRTFLKLVPPDAISGEFRDQVASLSTRAAYFKFHAALRELPDFSAYLGAGFDPRYLAQVKICPSTEAFLAAWQDAQAGRLPRAPLMEVQIPTVYDTTLAPPGHHVVSVWALWAPVRPAEGSWDTRRREMGERIIDLLTGYAPNFRRALVDWMLLTPPDIEARIGLTDGNIRHLDLVPAQLLGRRPLPGWAHYRTPVLGLYLCGAGTHPGGEVTGAPGHNAARAILADLLRDVAAGD
ncbi:MAG TPA: NAD(P)/FAD-dependent oxidoreductase [Methylomirabilota bacterium]|jgi:phytoene dehydrogenase-like protein|nr:NAD(P)/FAD-dependent oxidoreductase [Methylomirabilota bacterium]